MRWSEAGYLSRIVLSHAPRQASVSLILGVRQKIMKTLLIACALIVASASASEEQLPEWSIIDVTTHKIPRAGVVNVRAQADKNGISQLEIAAFGESYRIVGDELTKVVGFPLRGLEITHEAGYEILGGYSVHVKLRHVFYDASKTLRKQTAIITITEKKGLNPIVINEEQN